MNAPVATDTNIFNTSVPTGRPLTASSSPQNLHELRLTFLWPQLPNGKLGNGRQTYRALVAGQMATNASYGPLLYFYQPQSFTIAPVKIKFQISNCRLPNGERRHAPLRIRVILPFFIRIIRRAFTLIEVMVVMVLLSLIVHRADGRVQQHAGRVPRQRHADRRAGRRPRGDGPDHRRLAGDGAVAGTSNSSTATRR